MRLRARLLLLTVPLLTGKKRRVHGASATACPSCSVSLYQTSGFANRACSLGNDFGCYPGETSMWVRVSPEHGPGTCGGFFRCGDGRAAVRCGSRNFRAAPGQLRLNCSCAAGKNKLRWTEENLPARRRRRCGENAAIDDMGGVSAAFRRLPLARTAKGPADVSLKCCRNKPNRNGGIDWNATIRFTKPGAAAWPSVCEAMCNEHPSCRYFSHSVKYQNCLLCASCTPEIMLGDDTFASFQRAEEDPRKAYTGVLV